MHILAVVSDLHINHTAALCPPVVELDDGGTYHASPGQRFLWRSWLSFWDRVEAAAANGAPVTVVVDGDALELDSRRRSYQLITRNKSTVLRMAAEVLDRPAQLAGRIVFIRGTPAHVGKSAWSEEELAADFDNTLHDGERASWERISLKVEGVLFDIQHHGPLGRRPWAKLAPLGAMAFELLLQTPRPDVAIRAHNHQFYDTSCNYPVRCLGCGAWQLGADYLSRMAVVPRPQVGGWVIRVDGGRVECEDVRFEPGRGKIVTL